ncbi:MAG: selenocysteine-specific translation elongation factor, partial [Myxococcota bacterium]
MIGTAGHIDHGKTSLVRALTGVDLDTLPEEKARGITIALGFTHLALPDGTDVGFVDVPGHERLVRTMVAGATGIDAVLLCVSAVDGAMPQTREHVAILDLLGIRTGAVVLTMADLVDDELLELAEDDVRSLCAGTFLAGAPIVPFSSVTGRGKDALLAVIAGFPEASRGDPAAPFRLPVDREFVRSGFGVVVTGTTWSGTLSDGETVRLLPGAATARVRGIEVHGHKVTEALPGRRTALNLAGVEPEQVPRGVLVARGEIPEPSMIDVRYRHLSTADPLEDGVSVRVLHGTTERGARLYLAEDRDQVEPGSEGWVQL